MTETTLAAEGLFAETPDGPRLLGSRCATCESAYFPRCEICRNPECTGSDIRDARFGPRGRLWSATIQAYRPAAPAISSEPYQPYAVGVVDLEDHPLRVIGRLLTDNPEKIEIGSEVELVLASIGQDAEGREVISWQFKPVGSG